MGLSHPVACKVQEKFGSRHFRVATCSMQGFRTSMEDDHHVELALENHTGFAFLGVFDGHGGANASKYCAATIHKKCSVIPGDFTPEKIQNAVLEADEEWLVETNEVRNHGTTCVFALVDYRAAEEGKEESYNIIVSNTGDSRCVWGTLQEEESPGFIQCTEDHKPTNPIERARIAKAGGIVSNGRVDGDLSVSRALGDAQFKDNKAIPLADQRVSPLPDITHYTAKKGDWLLLACDGIFERLTTAEVAAFITSSLKKDNDPLITTRDLCTYSLDSGSKDNMTVALAVFDDGRNYLKPGEPQKIFIPSELHQDDPSFMNAYRRFAVDNGFPEVVGDVSTPEPQTSADRARPLLQLIAQLANEGQIELVQGADEDDEASLN